MPSVITSGQSIRYTGRCGRKKYKSHVMTKEAAATDCGESVRGRPSNPQSVKTSTKSAVSSRRKRRNHVDRNSAGGHGGGGNVEVDGITARGGVVSGLWIRSRDHHSGC